MFCKITIKTRLFSYAVIYLSMGLALEGVACRGDVIGCTVKFENDRDANGKVEIIFTLNGKRITQDKIEMDYSFMYSSSRKMYPYICMGHPGMSLLAKVSIWLEWKKVLPRRIRILLLFMLVFYFLQYPV